MADRLHVITGATGLLGSHVAEQLRAAGRRVRALVRPGSDTKFLQSLGVELATGDLADAASCEAGVAGADVVFHCAAKVSDWGAWKDFEREAVTSTRNIVEACKKAKVERLVHISSISVYGHPKTYPVMEDTPLGQRFWLWDYYPRSKLLAENIAREFGPNVVVVRPSWIYGLRDRVTIPRVVKALQEKRVPIIGSGKNFLNIIFAGDVARGVILAADHPQAAGQAYNLCSEGEVTQLDLVNALTDTLKLPRITRHVPYGLALRFAFVKEAFARLTGSSKPPTITRRAIYLIGRPAQYSVAKAKEVLGWRPQVPIAEGVRRSVEWYFGPKS